MFARAGKLETHFPSHETMSFLWKAALVKPLHVLLKCLETLVSLQDAILLIHHEVHDSKKCFQKEALGEGPKGWLSQ